MDFAGRRAGAATAGRALVIGQLYAGHVTAADSLMRDLNMRQGLELTVHTPEVSAESHCGKLAGFCVLKVINKGAPLLPDRSQQSRRLIVSPTASAGKQDNPKDRPDRETDVKALRDKQDIRKEDLPDVGRGHHNTEG